MKSHLPTKRMTYREIQTRELHHFRRECIKNEYKHSFKTIAGLSLKCKRCGVIVKSLDLHLFFVGESVPKKKDSLPVMN